MVLTMASTTGTLSRSALQTIHVGNSKSPARHAKKANTKDLQTKSSKDKLRDKNKHIQVTPVTGVNTSKLRVRTPWSTRRNTPYQRNPTSRALHTPHTVLTRKPRARKQTDTQNEIEFPMKHFELLNKTWRIYRVSPLYKFSRSTDSLRSYSAALSALIKAESAKGLAVGTDAETADMAYFSVLKGIKCSEDEPEAVEITLKQKPTRGSGQKEARVVLTAVLCCVGAQIADLQAIHSDFCPLPVMIVRGSLGLTSHLHTFLQTQFDCHISPVSLSALELSWMVAMWAGYAPERGGKPVHLQYKVPSEVDGLDTISLDIDPQDCAKLWKSVHEGKDESFHAGEVVTLIKAIEAHFNHHFRINLQAMSLHRVGTSTMFVGAEGKLKLFSVSHIQQTLSYLTQIILERTLVR